MLFKSPVMRKSDECCMNIEKSTDQPVHPCSLCHDCYLLVGVNHVDTFPALHFSLPFYVSVAHARIQKVLSEGVQFLNSFFSW